MESFPASLITLSGTVTRVPKWYFRYIFSQRWGEILKLQSSPIAVQNTGSIFFDLFKESQFSVAIVNWQP
jgi:hypothetical protein